MDFLLILFLYKRCQIAAADLYSAIKEKNIILENSEKLTMFPDYRVPQILNEMGIMVYDKDLTEIVKNKIKIKANSDEEIEIRLMTIYAVEKIKNYINKNGGNLKSIEIDYILWNEGEKMRKEIIPHHRTLTIFY